MSRSFGLGHLDGKVRVGLSEQRDVDIVPPVERRTHLRQNAAGQHHGGALTRRKPLAQCFEPCVFSADAKFSLKSGLR